MNIISSWLKKKWLIVLLVGAVILLCYSWSTEKIMFITPPKISWKRLDFMPYAFGGKQNRIQPYTLNRNAFLPSKEKMQFVFDFVSSNMEKLCNTTKRLKRTHLEVLKAIPIKYTKSKFGIIVTLPHRSNNFYVVQFTTFIYSSWKQITENAFEMLLMEKNMTVNFNLINLLVFCENPTCKLLPHDCLPMDVLLNATDGSRHLTIPGCYFQPTEQFNHVYKSVNSFAFINAPCMPALVARHDYFLRTDLDTFLSPRLLIYNWENEQGIITGKGGYCTAFTTARLKQLAQRRSLKHRGVHCTGSTWFGKSDLIYRLSAIAAWLSMNIYDNEFDPIKYPELKKYFEKSKIGTWPEWYQPVASMYAEELTVNAFVEGLSYKNVRGDIIDTESCRNSNVLNHLHIHTWHSECEFNKFKFLDVLVSDLFNMQPITIKIENIISRIGICLPVHEYCTYVAWYGLVKNANLLTEMKSSLHD